MNGIVKKPVLASLLLIFLNFNGINLYLLDEELVNGKLYKLLLFSI